MELINPFAEFQRDATAIRYFPNFKSSLSIGDAIIIRKNGLIFSMLQKYLFADKIYQIKELQEYQQRNECIA